MIITYMYVNDPTLTALMNNIVDGVVAFVREIRFWIISIDDGRNVKYTACIVFKKMVNCVV